MNSIVMFDNLNETIKVVDEVSEFMTERIGINGWVSADEVLSKLESITHISDGELYSEDRATFKKKGYFDDDAPNSLKIVKDDLNGKYEISFPAPSIRVKPFEERKRNLEELKEAYATLEKAFNNYKDKVNNYFGEKIEEDEDV